MAKRTLLGLLSAVLVAIGAFVYLSPEPPASSPLTAAARATVLSQELAASSRGRLAASTPQTRLRAAKRKARQARGAAARARARDKLDGVAVPKRGPATVREHTVVRTIKTGGNSTTAAADAKATEPPPTDVTAPPIPHTPVCTDFQWQQDAQAAYVANLSDPYGLDGAPGPANDDGLACSLLPVDPARPASTPAGAKPPPPPQPEPLPTAPTMQQLLAPQNNYFGVSTPQAPYDFKDFQIFSAAAGKLPNMDEFFLGWDHDFPRDQVIALWRRGALPILSWEPRPTVQPIGPDSDNTVASGFTLESIIDGSHDAYIDQFATAARDLGLPIAIRFAHEMNGNWFPWSEETNGNSRGQYVQAWRHVHDRFTALGADNVIWIWSPNVITARPSVRLAPLYPGDDYVDWLGIVGYYRRVYLDASGHPKDPTFDNTYSDTLAELRTVASKPIVLTEVGATEVGGNKPAWISSLFEGMAANPDIIGFVWFDQSVNGTDWRIESSSAATAAFASGVADPRYGSGVVYTPR